ncbi:SDR family NAD(P)-dependent oxidoreductase [Pectobacterium parmentieri]|uniref:SDR family NAD(P)-dependent oxidoreductase n=1 Tax=Pectobacterium parmentieri TaxID=1905730 RepID=UPI0018E000C6|nr:SDR family NAD(P)-dependent oxidoreductase [Pectobacterium parmentieri]MBI0551988.1 SDR family NAD(P)-dependent oxidoreductase [Pectobacterium parmentieri]MBI0561009.1 SDR family NAD(P)-dependent oxidoreductase [Pectobacterium parmentieri]MBI0565220.1 SDR family NAD(P)-dependent oxidoreductase [Pectobacterium parmentieri]
MLKGKRAIVTGGGRDFGQAVSVWLAREGVKVDLCARKQADAQASVDIIHREGGTARAYQCDIAHPDSVRDFSAQLLEDHTPVDVLVLSAAQWLEGALGEAMRFVLTQPHSCHINAIHFQGPTRADVGA